MPEESLYCKRCGKVMKPTNFYGTNDIEKYPSGKLDLCKKCITAHVDCWDSETFLWILKECDVPYVPDEWNKLLAKYAAEDPNGVKSTTVIGRYLAKMKLVQFKKYRYADTDKLRELKDNLVAEKMRQQGYTEVEIAEQIQKNSFTAPPCPEKPLAHPESAEIEDAEMSYGGMSTDFYDKKNNIDFSEEEEVVLSNAEKLALRTKWGKNYSVEEWLQLEKLYVEMTESFDIQTAAHVDNLKMLCKTSLKANQLIDLGDVEGANKMIKTYDMLMKQGRFTAAQNKAESSDFVDSVGELVLMCERDGFIPRFYTDGPQDKVDKVLQDNQLYLRQLVMDELNLGSLIEKALKEIQEDKEKEGKINAASETEDAEKAYEDSLFEVAEDGGFADLIASSPVDYELYNNDIIDDEDYEEPIESEEE